VSSLESDLLLIGASVFAADRASVRQPREDYGRRIDLSIPVVNIARLLPLIPPIELVLRSLSNDGWRLGFRESRGDLEAERDVPNSQGRTLLFSGGLDSLAAAIEFSRDRQQLQLVSHVTRNQVTDRGQQELVRLLRDAGTILPHFQFFVSSSSSNGPQGIDHDVESSQRTRSFLFLILGALAARRANHHELLYMAENGQMAISLPLTQGRIGAFSTHTAHPDVLMQMGALLSTALRMPLRVVNPYVHRTKAEVVRVIAAALPNAIPASNSCWRNARLWGGATHCGECIPCFIRRIAIEIGGNDNTPYARDPWREPIAGMPEDDEARRNLADLTEFVVRIEGNSDEEMMSEWPELHSANVDAHAVIEMYRRFAREARTVLKRYPALASLLA
jgi:7-cyano-7-deazaguanine synthase in queuosine biosynthesis